MLRVASLLALVIGWFGLAAFRTDYPGWFDERTFPVNTTVAQYFHVSARLAPGDGRHAEADTATAVRILMLNYSAYDSAYANKLHRCIQRQLPAATLTDFWEGSPEELAAELAGQQVVVVAYPSGGNPAALRAYGIVLEHFVQQGGAVLFTGTHEYGILQHFGLFDLDFGYFCAEPAVHEATAEHPVLAGTPGNFTLPDYAYPLDISDANFTTLADVRGYPVVGYKPLGLGKILYLGFEYYFDEPVSTRILANAIRWSMPKLPAAAAAVKHENWPASSATKRTEEVLYTGGKRENFAIKVYPNPYTVKATLEFELTKTTLVALDMTDETGRPVAELLRPRSLNAGAYRFELPNVPPGVYFVKFRSGEQTAVRKVVKVSAQ